MIKLTLFFSLLLSPILAIGQMNFQDSSVQVITYWDLGERYEYTVTHQKLKYTETDTTSNETITYDAEVTVIDSTANSYTVRWLYKNFKMDADDPISQKLLSISENVPVEIKIDELGSIQSVENWEELRDYMAGLIDSLRTVLPDNPEIDKVFSQIQGVYNSKAAIEATAIQDVQQFHNFFGGKFVLNETVTGQINTPNVYQPDKPFDTEVSVTLEELDEEYNEYQIRSFTEVNSAQLTQTTYEYLAEMFKNLNQEFPKRKDFQDLSNIVEIVSRIHNSGWVLESIMWKEVVSDGMTGMEIRHIQMK